MGAIFVPIAERAFAHRRRKRSAVFENKDHSVNGRECVLCAAAQVTMLHNRTTTTKRN